MPESVVPTINCQIESQDRGRFIIEPLEAGYGLTLGNAMRRVLLGCLPGAAITAVKIDGVQHEFSTIPHMKEDTMEFLQNIKGIRLRYLANRSDVLTLDVVGEREVTAADIKPSSVFEIVNPEHHLATLEGPEASLHAELNVEIGRGYVMVSSSEGRPIGLLPIDAVFTPIRRVNYRVEKARVGDRSDFDRLILDVWTDGTISPENAVAESARLLIKQFSTFTNIGKALQPVEEVVTAPSGAPERQDIALEQLGLSSRTFNALRRGGIATTSQLLEKSKEELLGLKNFGEKSWAEVQQRLMDLGLIERPPADEGPPPEEPVAAAEEQEVTEKVDMEEVKRKLGERFQVREER